MKFARLIILALLGCLLPATAQSASGSRTILILDASGSMWGQINGSTKIEIAQSTAEDLIKNRPKDLQMGLMAYGHRRKGVLDHVLAGWLNGKVALDFTVVEDPELHVVRAEAHAVCAAAA